VINVWNFRRTLFRNSLEKNYSERGDLFKIQMEPLVLILPIETKALMFKEGVLKLYDSLILKPFLVPLTEGKLIFLGKDFYLNRNKNDHFYWIQTYPFNSPCSWHHSLPLILCFIVVFLVLGLNNEVFFNLHVSYLPSFHVQAYLLLTKKRIKPVWLTS
jgi:hypothetical protein